jgi:hypothetical protein
LIPFKPYPHFHWVLLGCCIIFAFLRPEGALVSLLWFFFAYFYVFNKICLKVVGKKFFIPSRYMKKEEAHIFGLVLFLPYIICVGYSTFLLKELVAHLKMVVLT